MVTCQKVKVASHFTMTANSSSTSLGVQRLEASEWSATIGDLQLSRDISQLAREKHTKAKSSKVAFHFTLRIPHARPRKDSLLWTVNDALSF